MRRAKRLLCANSGGIHLFSDAQHSGPGRGAPIMTIIREANGCQGRPELVEISHGRASSPQIFGLALTAVFVGMLVLNAISH
jgi:hypothetical protein